MAHFISEGKISANSARPSGVLIARWGYEPAARLKRAYESTKCLIAVVVGHFGKYSLRDITPMLVERFKRERLATPVKINGKPRRPSSVNRELQCLSRVLTRAVDNGLLGTNPCSTFATRLAPHTDAFMLAALLGHTNLAMTARYTHATDQGKRQAVAALNHLGHENVTIPFPAKASQAGQLFVC